MKKQIIVITIITGCSKILSFVRELLMSYYYGASSYTDIYIMASTAANIMVGWMLAFQIIHTPLYQELKHDQCEAKANGFTLFIIGIQIIIGAILILAASFKGSYFVSLLAKGFDESTIIITTMFFAWALVAVLINAICSLILSESTCNGKVIFPNLTNLVVSIIQIIMIGICGITDNYLGLRFVLPVSAAAQLLLFIMMMAQNNRRSNFMFPHKEYMIKFLRLLLPVFAVYMMSDINSFIDKMFGSMLPEGSISALHYGYLLQHTVFTMFITALTTVIYPRMAESAASGRFEDLQRDFQKGADIVIVVFSFLSLFIAVYARPIVIVLFARGAFDETAINRTTQCTQLYLLALLPLAFKEFSSKIFQAVQDMKVNMYIGGIAISINLVLDYLLYENFKHIGLALGTCVATYCTVPTVLFFLHKSNQAIAINRDIIMRFSKIILMSMISIGIPALISGLFYKAKGITCMILYLLIMFLIESIIYYLILRKLKLIERLV